VAKIGENKVDQSIGERRSYLLEARREEWGIEITKQLGEENKYHIEED